MDCKSFSSVLMFILLNILLVTISNVGASCSDEHVKTTPHLTPNKLPSYQTPLTPKPNVPTPPSKYGKCPRDALKLGVCANLLGGLVSAKVGSPPDTPCCTLIRGLIDLEAAVCLCTAIKANVLNIIHLDVGVSISLLLNTCGKTPPTGFICA
ncbi:hypothetical protein AQUCO_11000012v1 [Aquilegia coerulea]|uniref:Bifunctional inhibitor/plant lipid transfer protein/seed storage helical domain-containing protein n=1 Tax=Aquilegia coerulea TaxID=218851 RepID=A0A2G5C2U1_AQUCA|nr:hypothetical protein AQUCO_11000012v1 [Aquilegia coerulea]